MQNELTKSSNLPRFPDSPVIAKLSTQWVAEVIAFSSEYGHNNPGWSANCVVGLPRVYEVGAPMADNQLAWAPRPTGSRNESITVRFADACSIEKIEVYETNYPGAITRVDALVDQEWRTIFETETTCGEILTPRIYEIIPNTIVLSNTLRFSIDQNNIENWYEIDAIKLTGRAAKFLNGPPTQYTGKLFNSTLCSDITFRVFKNDGSELVIPAHRCILVTRSPLFASMLRNNCLESGEKVINDIDGELFFKLLQWMYEDFVLLNQNQVIPMAMLANYYQIPELLDLCERTGEHLVDLDNAVDLAEVFSENGLEGMCNIALDFIAKNVAQIANLKNLSQPLLVRLITNHKVL